MRQVLRHSLRIKAIHGLAQPIESVSVQGIRNGHKSILGVTPWPISSETVNGVVYGDCELEREFDSGAGGARQRLAGAAKSGCFATTGTEGSRVFARAISGSVIYHRGGHAEEL